MHLYFGGLLRDCLIAKFKPPPNFPNIWYTFIHYSSLHKRCAIYFVGMFFVAEFQVYINSKSFNPRIFFRQ